MAAVNIDVQPTIINWVLSQTNKEQLGEKLNENINCWLNGTKSPTFKQIEDLSKKSHIPLGYFFLKTPPEEKFSLLEYRTIDSADITKPSRDLIDTIYNMESVQEWMIKYKTERYYDYVGIVSSLKGYTDINTIADIIRDDLDLNIEWYKYCQNSAVAFNKIRGHLEECGVVIMVNGIVGQNTHRILDVNEFRAFAIIDKIAPLIFINGADSIGGRLFSLVHEAVHIWMGESNLYNDRKYSIRNIKPIEIICNAVAGELLVPQKIFLKKWDSNKDEDIYIKIKDLSKVFKCSSSVIARRAFDNAKINKNIYNKVIEDAIKAYNEKEKKSGGDYYRVARSKLDGVFVRALCESVNSGQTSYTEAYRLTNTTGKTFHAVVNGLGGTLW